VPLESIHEQISAALQTRLRTIAEDQGTTYWYTPDKVLRVIEFSGADLDDSYEHLLFLRADPYKISEGATSRVDGEAPFTVLIAKRDARTSQKPQDEENDEQPIGPTVVSRIVEDVHVALLSEVTLGALAWNVMHGSFDVDPSYFVDGWLCATVTFTVRYDYAA